MFTVEYCGYHTHNPHYDIIDRPSGSSSYLFLLVLSPMVFTFPDRPAEKAQPGACILYAPGYPQYYQAARMDETPPSRVFFRITMPLLSSTFWMVTIVSVIHAFKTYNEVYSMFGGNGAGPGNSAITIVYYIYDMFFNRSQVHYASAAAIIFFIIILALTALQKWVSKKFVHYV